ncbi:hypothetical protein KSP39_PZI014496 [Platanthera zijinensis]|uniref:Uncharacterized protein n=1 Tax=Platanthera zijinensis TaxID=2320716 RepID=A0AAP0G2T6_9ASPA
MQVGLHNEEDDDSSNFKAILCDTTNFGLGDIGKIKIEQGAAAPMSRAVLWKAGHKRKTVEYISTNVAELLSKIDELSSQKSQSAETVSHGRDDILAFVLCQEHPGRVRVGGKFSTIISFFKNDRRSQRT